MATINTLDANMTAKTRRARRRTRRRMDSRASISRANVATMKPHSMIRPVVAQPRGSPQRMRELVAATPAIVIACVEVIKIRNRPRAMSMYGIRPKAGPGEYAAGSPQFPGAFILRSTLPVGSEVSLEGLSSPVVGGTGAVEV